MEKLRMTIPSNRNINLSDLVYPDTLISWMNETGRGLLSLSSIYTDLFLIRHADGEVMLMDWKVSTDPQTIHMGYSADTIKDIASNVWEYIDDHSIDIEGRIKNFKSFSSLMQ